jgi:hypothetical protein
MDDEGFDDYDRELELALYKEYRAMSCRSSLT